MSALLPSLQARQVRAGLVDYLTTTFALADADTRATLGEFLQDADHGIFKGPYVRLRLPFRADDAADQSLNWTPPFPAYRHQAAAYRRLTSKGLGPGERPQPTVVTTGTGSGKTEAFLHPILDHVLRARSAGFTGVKALILYPMNALADDQAERLTRLLTGDPSLAEVRAGLYTGDSRDGQSGQGRTAVSEQGLITNRTEMRQNPPDILLTNYKMLDQLLLRPEDAPLWQSSTRSLQYLVLDEFHTYDGAQGTDVAMLLRRLGLTLAENLRTQDAEHPLLAHYDERPLGPVTPVATSATLGDGNDPQAMLDFAHQVFGERMDASAAITEERQTVQEFTAAAVEAVEQAGLRPRRVRDMLSEEWDELAALGERLRGEPDDLIPGVLAVLYDGAELGSLPASALVRAHPDVQALFEHAHAAIALRDLAHAWLPEDSAGTRPGDVAGALSTVLAVLSHLRLHDRSEASVEITLWVREVSRVDRVVADAPDFRWHDDGEMLTGAAGSLPALPATHCRFCGRSGWAATLTPTGRDLADRDESIRGDALAGNGRVRAMLHAPGEALRVERAAAEGEPNPEQHAPALRWLDLNARTLHLRRPLAESPDDENLLPVVPVVMIDGDTVEADKRSQQDECPACGATDGIRFLGSAISTLLSTSLTTLFGDVHLSSAEKRALVFTDSVQDAAHRAGFVESRSYAMSLRAGARSALSAPMTLPEWTDATMRRAEDDPFARYRLVPPALTEEAAFRPYWEAERDQRIPLRATANVRRRLLFDLMLEVGLSSTVGRTLEATGSVGVHVDAGGRDALLALARSAWEGGAPDAATLDTHAGTVGDDKLLHWSRGVLERLRRDGAVHHEWLSKYVQDDGARIWIWGKRKRSQGAPAFPSGRPAPAFAVAGEVPTKSAFTRITSPRGWWAHWAQRTLRVTAGHGAALTRRLMDALVEAEVLTATPTERGATAFGIPAERIHVTPLGEDDLREVTTLLVCDVCASPVPVAPAVAGELAGAPCTTDRCAGRLHPTAREEFSFYRTLFGATDVRRINAREHTSLLEGAERRAIENGFKRTDQRAGDPNVLVATPTLEMGIDIGDLTTVLLSSLPSRVASYLQRVGRGGRLTGSSMVLAYVSGRGDQLPRLQDPLSVLNGAVRPPATYLDAEEILQRQFLASVVDSIAREGGVEVPRTVGDVMRSSGEGSFLGEVLSMVQRRGEVLLQRFVRTFPDAGTPGITALRAWALDHDSSQGLAATVHRATAEYARELEGIRRRLRTIDESLPALEARAKAPGAATDDVSAWRTALGSKRVARRQISDLTSEGSWIGGLELRGLLPNYSLVDDTVELAVSVSWQDEETKEYRTTAESLNRPSARALTEFAPGAHFYALGREMVVHGLEINDESDVIERAFCDTCGYVQDLGAGIAALTSCPRCGSPGIADTGQRLRSVGLHRVFSEQRRHDSDIDDAREDRVRRQFEELISVDFDPDLREWEWSVAQVGLGVAAYRRLPIRRTNLGRRRPNPSQRRMGGRDVTADAFRLCAACGKLDGEAGFNGPAEHRGWCPHRMDPQEHTRAVVLHRELRTQGVAISLPETATADSYGVPSLTAALLLGLREVMGGEPDHLEVVTVPHPLGDAEGGVREALLVHDAVPGGTGYLSELATPASLWRVLVASLSVLESCPCQEEGRSACHRCLLPYGNGSAWVNRSVAEQRLRELLALPEGVAAVDAEKHEAHWSVAEEALQAGAGESPLELRFRTRFAERLRADLAVRETTSPGGTAYQFTGPDNRAWSLTPQVDLHGTRPDFLLQGQGEARIAVFTDGWSFHATAANNRLADDAVKRQRLRDQGIRVVSVTYTDLDDPAEPAWCDPDIISPLMGRGLSAEAVDEHRAGPVDLLRGMVLRPSDPARIAMSGNAPLLVYLAAIGQGAQPVSTATPPVDWVVARAAGLDAPDAGDGEPWQGIAVVKPHWALAARMEGESWTEVALALDDRPEALEQQGYREAWAEWLHLANLLAASEATVTVTTTTAIGQNVGESSAEETSAPLPPSWQGVDLEYVPEEARSLARLLAEAGVEPPEAGAEVAGGIPVEFAWSDHHVAVVVGETSDDEVEALHQAGWSVHHLGMDLETVARDVHTTLNEKQGV